jgi:hypothetical protein
VASERRQGGWRRAAPGVAVAAALLLAGCANPLAARRARLQHFVGQNVTALIAAEGVPNRSFQAAGITYLGYVTRYVDLEPPLPLGGPPWIWGWYAEPPPIAVERGCETVFAVKDDIVQGFTLHGNACG